MIRNLFNLITAWGSVVLLVLVVVIWLLRILVQKKIVKKNSFLFNANKVLRKHHKATGIAFLVIAFIHGLLSSAKVFSFNWGSISFLFIVIMGLSYMVKKKFQRKTWVNMHRVLTVLVVVTFAIHIDEVGISGFNLLNVPAAPSIELPQEEIEEYQQQAEEMADVPIVYEDGIYTGVADGYGPNLTVEVKIENNLITSVEVVSHNEDKERFFGPPIELLPGEIVESQSINVDSISGATYTSVGIKNAVLDALSKAITQGMLPLPEVVEESGFGFSRHKGH